MTLKELIQRAIDTVVQGMDSPALRASVEAAVEAVLPVVFGRLSDELQASPDTRHLLRRTKDLPFVDGRITLTDDVLTAYLRESVLFDPDDTAKLYSLVEWHDLVRGVLDERLGHYALERGSILAVVEPGSSFAFTSGDTVNLKLTTPCALDIPALNSNIDGPTELLDLLQERLVQALRPVTAK